MRNPGSTVNVLALGTDEGKGVASVSGGILQSYGNNQLNGNNSDGTMTTIATH